MHAVRIKELEEGLAQTSDQCDTLKEQVEQSTRHAEGLAKMASKLEESVRQKEAALSSIGREMESLRAAIQDKDDALKSANRTLTLLHDEVVGWNTRVEGMFLLLLSIFSLMVS